MSDTLKNQGAQGPVWYHQTFLYAPTLRCSVTGRTWMRCNYSQWLSTTHAGEYPFGSRLHAEWVWFTRSSGHPSAPTAYETAISLMQDSDIRPISRNTTFPSCCKPRYQGGGAIGVCIVSSSYESARAGHRSIGSRRSPTLVRDAGLRTSVYKLRAAYPRLAEKFAEVNRDLEALTMSLARTR